MNKNKRIRYRHVHALRDLSRCHTFSNVEIKKGVLFRSGYLCKFKKEQANEFAEEFNIGTVIDLRTDAEVKNAPDAHLDGIKYYHIPILEEFDNPLITKENRNKILLDISKNKGGAVKYFDGIYKNHFKKCDEKIKYFDSKLDCVRLENGGYNFGLLKKKTVNENL